MWSLSMMKVSAAALAMAALTTGAEAKPLGYLYPSLFLTSDYRYDGYSNNSGDPALQLSLHLYRPDGYYAGIFTSNAKTNAPGSPSWEIDYYVGKNFETKKTKYKLEAMYSAFPDNDVYGPTFDFLQFKAGVARKIDDKLTLGLTAAYVPSASYGSGVATKLVGDATYQITPWLSLNGTLGKRWIERGYDRTYWDGGTAVKWKSLTFDLRYVDTDLEPAQCFFSDACESAVVGKLTYTAPMKYKFNTWK